MKDIESREGRIKSIKKERDPSNLKELINFVAEEKGIDNPKMLNKVKMDCAFNGESWRCGGRFNEYDIDNIDHINILDKTGKCNLFVGKEPITFGKAINTGGKDAYISFKTKRRNDPDYHCIIGNKYNSKKKVLICGTIEDFIYYFAPAYRITLDKD
ncbi:hypothetical protein LCGC14_0223340 [marine sediment metagenome]|uniref:Uncharacterized protein n=1 Tax=marine sediment metagenome TaxID=412755 RepID=A0A0F9WWG2_9ZZZZ|nr:hypothetical protein [bacterium]